MEGINLNYSVDISESSKENGDFIIQGTAINATTTDNGHRFLVEELRPAAKGMAGIPLLVDHDAIVANIKGRVLSGTFNEAAEKVDFKAKVMDKTAQEMIKDKRLNSVSIGANVKEIEENDDGTITARGIKIKELSLVAVPADDGATFAIAMSEAFNKTKQTKQTNLQKLKGGLSEEMKENDNVVASQELDVKEEVKVTEESNEMAELDEKIMALEIKAKKRKLAKLLEADVDEEESKEEPEEEKEEPKEEEEEAAEEEEEEVEKTEESNKLNIVEGAGTLRGHSFSYNW